MLVDSLVVPDHMLKLGRRETHLRDMGLADMKELFSKSSVSEAVRGDVRLLMAVGNLWGPESLERFQFADGPPTPEMSSKLTLKNQGLGTRD